MGVPHSTYLYLGSADDSAGTGRRLPLDRRPHLWSRESLKYTKSACLIIDVRFYFPSSPRQTRNQIHTP